MLAVALFNTILEFYNDKKGLFPWGITENGDELFWNFIGDIVAQLSRQKSEIFIMN